VAQTDFNVQAYLRSIGSRGGGGDIEFSSTIHPTVQLADFSDLTPAHQPPLASFGGIVPAVVARFGATQIHSRGTGGVFILDWSFNPGLFLTCVFAVQPPVVLANLITHAPQTFSNAPPASVVESGDVAATPDQALFPAVLINMFPNGVWLPPGATLLMTTTAANAPFPFCVTLADVPVGEGGD